MDVKHDVTDDDRKPENVAAAHEKRQAAEDAETLKVRGPQRPADQYQPPSAPPDVKSEQIAEPVARQEPGPRGAYRRSDLKAQDETV